MDWSVIVMRLLHVVLGVFWAGTLLFTAFFLQPAVRDTGPDGGKVMGALVGRGLMTAMPVAAILTIVSGLGLYARISGGFSPEYMRSAAGMIYGIGGVTAIIGLATGMGLIRPSMTKAAALMQSASQATGADREAKLAEVQALRLRAAAAGNIVTALILVSIVTMAIARYV
jgi:uncharacterized membrane protein